MLRDSGGTDRCADSEKSREARIKSVKHLRGYEKVIRNH